MLRFSIVVGLLMLSIQGFSQVSVTVSPGYIFSRGNVVRETVNYPGISIRPRLALSDKFSIGLNTGVYVGELYDVYYLLYNDSNSYAYLNITNRKVQIVPVNFVAEYTIGNSDKFQPYAGFGSGFLLFFSSSDAQTVDQNGLELTKSLSGHSTYWTINSFVGIRHRLSSNLFADLNVGLDMLTRSTQDLNGARITAVETYFPISLGLQYRFGKK
jgi:OmpW family